MKQQLPWWSWLIVIACGLVIGCSLARAFLAGLGQ